MYVICVTGTPGTGKSTFAQSLAKTHNLYYLDVLQLIHDHKLSEEFDSEMQTHLVDLKDLTKSILQTITSVDKKKYEGVVVDSHLSHYLPSHLVTLCFVITTPLSTLKQRLLKRKYSKQKINDNLEAETFETCLLEAHHQGHDTVLIET